MDETIIEGDIDAFCNALDNGSMQAQWEKDKAKCQAWIAQQELTACDASLD